MYMQFYVGENYFNNTMYVVEMLSLDSEDGSGCQNVRHHHQQTITPHTQLVVCKLRDGPLFFCKGGRTNLSRKKKFFPSSLSLQTFLFHKVCLHFILFSTYHACKQFILSFCLLQTMFFNFFPIPPPKEQCSIPYKLMLWFQKNFKPCLIFLICF